MSNLAISPALTVPSSGGSDAIQTTGTDSSKIGFKDSDFSKKLAKAVNSYPSDTRKKAPTAKEKNSPDSNVQASSTGKLGHETKDIRLAKPESSKSPKSNDAHQSDSTQDDGANDQKANTLKDDSEPVLASDEKNPTPKSKENKNEVAADAVSPLVPVVSQPIVETQTDQPDGNSAGEGSFTVGAVAQDKPTPNSSEVSANNSNKGDSAQNKGVTENTEDPIHNLNSGATFFKQLMSADDTKIVPTAPVGNAPEISILQNNTVLNGAGVTKDDSSAKQIPAAVNGTNPVPTVQTQNMLSQQVAISDPTLQSLTQSQPVAGGGDKTKNSDDLKTSDASETSLSGMKASDGASSVLTPSKDVSNTMPKLNSGASQPELTDQGTKPSDSFTVGQAASRNQKGQTVNLPIIQTQLSVNNQPDKTRTDNVVALSTEQPHSVDVSTKVSTPSGTSEPVNKEDLFAQIVEKAKVSLNHGNGEMEVNLKPDHLGKLHLKVSVENQLVTAKFVAESQQVKEIIETNLNQLRRSLQDNGIQVDQLMVSVGQHQNNGGFQNTSHNSSGFAGQQNNRGAVNQEMPFKSADNQVQPRRSRGQTAIDLIA